MCVPWMCVTLFLVVMIVELAVNDGDEQRVLVLIHRTVVMLQRLATKMTTVWQRMKKDWIKTGFTTRTVCFMDFGNLSKNWTTILFQVSQPFLFVCFMDLGKRNLLMVAQFLARTNFHNCPAASKNEARFISSQKMACKYSSRVNNLNPRKCTFESVWKFIDSDKLLLTFLEYAGQECGLNLIEWGTITLNWMTSSCQFVSKDYPSFKSFL
jgi:hypothetical protein